MRDSCQHDCWTADKYKRKIEMDEATYRRASRSLPVSVLRASDERLRRSGGGGGPSSDVLLTLISSAAA